MTVFPDGTKEPLHGHNYRVFVTLDLRASNLKLEGLVSFSQFKTVIRRICDAWDEKVLLAEACPFLKLRPRKGRDLEFTLCGKRYVLPTEETLLLPIDNITTEGLAEEFVRQLLRGLRSQKILDLLNQVEVRVEETPGQGASIICRAPFSTRSDGLK